MNRNHKFKLIKSGLFLDSDSFICLKCTLCFCGCGLDVEKIINLNIVTFENFNCIIQEINNKSCCIISDEEYLIKQIIE